MATSPFIRKSTPEALELHVVRQGESDPNQFTIENGTNGRLEDFNREYFSVGGYFGTFDPQIFCAAPEMLEALRRIAQPLDCGCVPCRGQCRSQTALECEVEERQDIARAAILKATGASNG